MRIKPVKVCRNCKKNFLVPFLDFGKQPNGNRLTRAISDEIFHDISFGYCKNCTSIQILKQVNPKEMFDDHPYLTSTSKPYLEDLQRLVEEIYDRLLLKKGDSVLDIGCNDGTLLGIFKAHQLLTLGVDPSKTAKKHSVLKEINVIQSYWTNELAESLLSQGVKPKLITSTASFYHMSSIIDWVSGVEKCLDDEGMFVAQLVSMQDIFEKNSFDQFYHEHTYIHSLHSLIKLFQGTSMKIVDVIHNDSQGGSYIIFVAKINSSFEVKQSVQHYLNSEKMGGLGSEQFYKRFNSRFLEKKETIYNFFSRLALNSIVCAGAGASLRGVSLINYCGLSAKNIKEIVEVNPEKIGLLTPKSHIPIVSNFSTDLFPQLIVILSWTFREHFIKIYEDYTNSGGTLFFPDKHPFFYGDKDDFFLKLYLDKS
jgi:hypothetical protein